MRDYSIWFNFVENDVLSEELKLNIKASWLDSKERSLPYKGEFSDVLLDQLAMQNLIMDNQVHLHIIDEYMKKVAEGISEECKFAVFLVNSQGLLIRRISNFEEATLHQIGVLEGASWSLEERGATATGIALSFREPNGVKAHEHYQDRYHEYITLGLPIYNTEGQLVHVLSLIVPDGSWPRIIDALMLTAVQGIEGEIFHNEYKSKIEKLSDDLIRKNKAYKAQTNLINYIFDNVSDMIFTLDRDKNFVKVNRTARLFLQKGNGASSLDELYSNVRITDFSGRDISVHEDPVYMVFKGQNSINAEVCIHWENGEKDFFYMDAMPFKDGDGQGFAIGILKNTTDFYKLVELKNRHQKKAGELEDILNTISEGVAIIDPSENCILLNSACNEIFEYKNKYEEENLKIGMVINYRDVMDIEGNPIGLNEYPTLKVIRGKMIRDEIYKIVVNNKVKYLTVSGSPVFNNEGAVEYAVMSFSEVTKIQRQKNKINEQKQFIQTIIDGLGAPVATISYPQGRYELVNYGYLDTLGRIVGTKFNTEDVIGKTFEEVVPSLLATEFRYDVGVEADANVPTGPKILEYTDFNGVRRCYQIIYSPTFDGQGQINYITAVGIDLTEETKAKREADALAKMKEEYFTIISHELRSPINVVHSAVQMLNSDIYQKEFNGNTKKMLSRIEKNTQRLLDLVNNFLDITKAEAGFMNINYSKIELNAFAEALLESLQPSALKKAINLKLTNECESKMIRVDVEKLERILINLLTNAIKFTDPAGKVILGLSENDEYLSIKVSDNGIGIPTDKLNKIFDRFYIVDGSLSRKNQGTGIGLSLVKKLVELMKGKITVESQEGVGSEFALYLPKYTK